MVASGFAAEPASPVLDTGAAAFDAANKLYEQGKFADASAAYAQLAKDPSAGAAIQFNLGNALFKSGQIGRAVAAYRKAEQLAPRDPDVRANLRFARSQAQGPTLAPSRWADWLAKFSLNEWTLLVTAAFWAWLAILALLQWRPALRPAMRGYVLTLLVATTAFGACLGSAYYHTRVARTAIVVLPEAVVRYGPLDESQTAFTAHDGAEFRVLDQKDGWLEVTDGATRTGWLRQDLIVISPQS